jgi:hypothetical protein
VGEKSMVSLERTEMENIWKTKENEQKIHETEKKKKRSEGKVKE